MPKRHFCSVACVIAALVLSGCQSSKAPRQTSDTRSPSDPEPLAREVATDTGVVGKHAPGYPEVLVLEETHNSRASQVQHAITMVRLHDKHGMRDIVLEGYLQDRPPIETAWFTRAWSDQNAIANARVAVRLLKEGEISAAEFMKLVYDDIQLHPAEKSSEYNLELDPKAFNAIEKLIPLASPDRQQEITSKLEAATKGNAIPAEEQLAIAEELESIRTAHDVALSQTDLVAWRSWISFWRGRADGNKTMIAALQNASAGASTLFVLNIGAAHTEGICDQLGKAQTGYAVITSLALSRHDNTGDLEKGYAAKEKRQSVFSNGYFVRSVLSPYVRAQGGKKPEPVLNEPWFRAKAEFYEACDRIAGGALPPKGPPNDKPPYGFGKDFDKEFFDINPLKIAVVSDDRRGGKPNAVLFPVTLKTASGRRTTVWVKAARASVTEVNPESIENMLKNALAEIQTEHEAPNQTEDPNGRIKVSTRTIVTVAATPEAARRTVLVSS